MMAQPRTSSAARLGYLLNGLADVPVELDVEVTSISLDSRTVRRGGLFLACAGSSAHGLDYLSQALANGAAVVVWEPHADWSTETVQTLARSVVLLQVKDLSGQAGRIAARFYGHPDRALLLIGITGTNGKTSCTQYIARALSAERRCGTIGTLGIGFPDALVEGTHTTPDAVTLQAALSELRSAGADAVVMEVSSHALDQGRVAGVGFDIAVFTNLSRDHLDYHGSFSAYGEAKRRLFQTPGLRAWVVNLDDAFGEGLLVDPPQGVDVIGYGQGADHSYWRRVTRRVWALSVQSDDSGMTIELDTSWGRGQLHTRLLGRFNVSNLLAVAAVLLQQNVPLAQVIERLAALTTVAGRMERFGGGEQPLVIVDYAHTPDALEHVLAASRAHTRGRLFCVFGCGGNRDSGKRPEMAAIAEALADQVIVTDDNPRKESGESIIADILSGMKQPAQARVERDRAKAIRLAVNEAEIGDVVLVAGKGHENYQLVGDAKLMFDDRVQVRQALQERQR